jgi:hypothetical protein
MTPKLATKSANKPDPEHYYIALEPIAGEWRTVKQGERLRGDDPYVSGNFRSLVHEQMPPEERPNYWHLVADPVPEPPHVIIPPSLPPWRQVQSTVDVYTDSGHAPGSPGAKSGRPSGFGTAIRDGQVFDVLLPDREAEPGLVLLSAARDVTFEDIEQLERAAEIGESG